MNWDDTGFLLSKNRYNENSIITEIFTKERGKVSGIIFGGTSKKIKNYLQVGNLLYTNYNSKSVNRIGYFKIEISKAFTPIYFDDPKKLNCISSSMNLIKILTADSQRNEDIYKSINDLYKILEEPDWLKRYIFWELNLLSILGFNLDLKQMVNKKILDNKTVYFAKSSTERKLVPNFLIDKDENQENIKDLLNGLKLVGDFLDKTILKPNNINHPLTREQFINSLK
ncbi:DNA repair protein RecO [Candidatus Pelagibacter sp. HIMB1321]|uniref:DNA repair protein RecO n=1 Tax=Candidatus Pelagibacter sp. HIMB1321 TaxID=1388755 RepID=UPI000A0809D0|nr:DNA repair protein RecO [Candidatus Pelagibacter sp. HIMB1321]SMF75773.1 DNA replication and repair protein RecO [Candidatus Pelagibacter sp. HIMB1321]